MKISLILLFTVTGLLSSCAHQEWKDKSHAEKVYETPQNVVQTDKGNVIFNFQKWKVGEIWNYGIKIVWFDKEGFRSNYPKFLSKDGLQFGCDSSQFKLSSSMNTPPRSVASVEEIWSTETMEYKLDSDAIGTLTSTKNLSFTLKGKNFDVSGKFGPDQLQMIRDFYVIRVER